MTDRTKDMVNVSGMKVYTTTVDEVLYRHPGVLMAAAFGVPDPKMPGSERVMRSPAATIGFASTIRPASCRIRTNLVTTDTR